MRGNRLAKADAERLDRIRVHLTSAEGLLRELRPTVRREHSAVVLAYLLGLASDEAEVLHTSVYFDWLQALPPSKDSESVDASTTRKGNE